MAITSTVHLTFMNINNWFTAISSVILARQVIVTSITNSIANISFITLSYQKNDESNISDGICDGSNNHLFCEYDGGDCCKPIIYVHKCEMNSTCYCHFWMRKRFSHFIGNNKYCSSHIYEHK